MINNSSVRAIINGAEGSDLEKSSTTIKGEDEIMNEIKKVDNMPLEEQQMTIANNETTTKGNVAGLAPENVAASEASVQDVLPKTTDVNKAGGDLPSKTVVEPIKHIELDPNLPLDLENVWFVKVLDIDGSIKVVPCMFGFGEDCKTDEDVSKTFIDFSTGNVYASAKHEPFAALDNFVSAHRWEKLDLETMIVKERMFDGDSDEAIKYSVLTTRDDMGKIKCHHQYGIDISCVVSGQTKKSVVADASKNSLASLQKENYKKYMGIATYNIYRLDFGGETYVEQVLQYAKEYTDRYKQMYSTKMKKVTQALEGEENGNAVEKREVNPYSRVNFDNVWFVTHINEEGKLIVSPCVLDSDKSTFVDYSTGYVYKAPKFVPFAMMEGYVGAYRWQQIELMSLELLERGVCKDIAAERWLDAPLLTNRNSAIIRPWNNYAISIMGVVTAKEKVVAFLSDNPFTRSYRDFSVMTYKEKLRNAVVSIFAYDDDNKTIIKDVCQYATTYTDRLNPKVKNVVPQLPIEELESKIKKDKKAIKKRNKNAEKQKKEKEHEGEGIFAAIKGFFVNRKYKKNKREIENALEKE